MLKRKINKVLIVIGLITALLGIALGTFNYINSKKISKLEEEKIDIFIKEDEEQIDEVSKKTNNTSSPINYDYKMVIEIPKINLKKGLYDINSKYNNVNYNIQVLKESNMPDVVNGNLILASHNGNSNVSYFNKLYQLELNDVVYIYYDNYKYTYQISNIYEEEKDGSIVIHKDNNKTIIALITCKKGTKDKQLVYIGNLINKETY